MKNEEEKNEYLKNFVQEIVKRLDKPVEAVSHEKLIPTEQELASDIYTILKDSFNTTLILENNKIYLSIKDIIFEVSVSQVQ